MKTMLIILSLSLSHLCSSYGQSEQIIRDARALFDKPVNINSISLHGFFSDENEVQLHLAYDDDSYRGFCYYPSSDTRIIVEGGIVRNKLILYETDMNNIKIGMWKIDVDQTEHKAVWRDVLGKSSFNTVLRKMDLENSELVFSGPYCTAYDARIEGQEYRLRIYRIRGQKIRTTFMNYDKRYYYPLVSKCLDDNCNSFNISLESSGGKREIIFNDTGDKTIKAKVKYKDGQNLEIIFQKTDHIKLHEVDYLGKLYRIHISYPLPDDYPATGFIQKEVAKILERLKKDMDNCVRHEDENESRLNYYANGWFDLGLISEDVFSGVFTIQSDCFDEVRTFPILINAKTGTRIKVTDQFRRNFNIRFYFSQYLKEQFRTIPEFNSSIFRGYLKPDSFRNMYLSDQGIIFATDFNTILGTQRIILPYSDIKDEIKRRSILRKVIKN